MSINSFKIRKGVLGLVSLSSAPSSPDNGEMYYDSALGKFQLREANTWTTIGAGGSTSVTYSVTSGEALSANTAIYICSTSADGGRTVGQAYKLDVNNSNRYIFAGFTTSTVLSGVSVTVQVSGVLSGFTGLPVGLPIYASLTTPGSYQTTAPTGTSLIVPLGLAESSTSLIMSGALFSSASGTTPTTMFTFGYALGGLSSGGSVRSVQKLTFAGTESNSQTTNVLSQGLYTAGGTTSSTKSYCMGGSNTTAANSTIEAFVFIGETSSQLASVNLTNPVRNNPGTASSSTKGYAFGGTDSSNVPFTAIQTLTFSGETTGLTGASLGSALYGNMATYSGAAAYTGGGYNSGNTSQNAMFKLTFAGEALSTLGTTLSASRGTGFGTFSSTKGYIGGGGNAVGTSFSSVVDAVDFATDIVSAIVATLVTSITECGGGMSSGAKGYSAGGTISGSTYNSLIQAIIFSGDTTATISATIGTPLEDGPWATQV